MIYFTILYAKFQAIFLSHVTIADRNRVLIAHKSVMDIIRKILTTDDMLSGRLRHLLSQSDHFCHIVFIFFPN